MWSSRFQAAKFLFGVAHLIIRRAGENRKNLIGGRHLGWTDRVLDADGAAISQVGALPVGTKTRATQPKQFTGPINADAKKRYRQKNGSEISACERWPRPFHF
jgi:hypothetical protein